MALAFATLVSQLGRVLHKQCQKTGTWGENLARLDHSSDLSGMVDLHVAPSWRLVLVPPTLAHIRAL